MDNRRDDRQANVMILRLTLRAAASILQFGGVALLARTTGAASFGQFAAALGAAGALTAFMQLGVPGRLLRGGTTHSLRQTLTLMTMAAAVCSLVLVAAFGLTGRLHEPWITTVIAFAVSEFMVTPSIAYLYGNLRTRSADVLLIGQRAIPFCGIAIGTQQAPDSIFTYAAVAYSATILILVPIAIKPHGASSRPFDLIRESRPYWAQSLAVSLQQTDVTIVGAGLGPGDAAGYGAAFRLASPVHLVTVVLSTTFIPKLTASSRCRKDSDKLQRQYLRVSLSYAFLVALASPLTIWAGPLLYGPDFVTYQAIFPMLMASSAISVINQCLSGILYSRNAPRVVATFTWLGVVFALAGACVGVALESLAGVAIAGLASQLILAALLVRTTFPHCLREEIPT